MPRPAFLAACLAIPLLLAGCSGGGDGDEPGVTTSATATSDTAGAPGPLPPEPVEVPVEWEGAVATGAWACEPMATGCHIVPEPAAFGVHEDLLGLAGNVSGNLTLAWTPSTAVTDQFVFEATSLTPGCADCESTRVPGRLAGVSPLVMAIADLPVPEGAVLRLVVYADKYVEAQGAAAGASGQQQFVVSGTLLVRP